jgi:periplasmic divalent cation tolerance protein
VIIVYITCESKKQATEIGRHLLKKRLCTCVNIFEGITAIYWWPPNKNQLCEDKEAVLIVKTVEEKFAEIANEVTKIHSSETPCILSLKVGRVNKLYLDWLAGEIK